MAPKIRVHIADDHAVLRAGLRLLIQSQADMEVVGESGSADETFARLEETPADVLTLDLSMPGGGIGLLKRLSAQPVSPRVVVLTMHDEAEYFRSAIAAGAAGYVVKKSADAELLTAIRTVAEGRTYTNCELSIAPNEAAKGGEGGLRHAELLAGLSQREREVLEFVAKGHTNQAIADQLSLSVKTVESYRARLMTKLSLGSRADLTRFALESGLLK